MANEVIIERFNEAYIKVRCEPSTAKELNEFFKFEVPNAKFMPSVRRRLWSGYIHLFSPATGKIYSGLLPYVQRYLQENGYKVKVESVFKPKTIDKQLTRKFVRSISKNFKARDYQIDAIHHILERNRGIILSPTGSGKSFIIYSLIRYYLQLLESKILLVVPTTSLVEQMYSDFREYGWFPDDHCHKLYAGHDKYTDKEVVISTWQSIYKMPKTYFAQFGVCFVDEAHLAKAKSLTGIMTKLHDCKYRIGLTGTLDGKEVHRLVLEGLFGICDQVTTTAELVKKKYLSNLEVKCLVLDHTKKNRIKRTYQEEMDYISTYESRNIFIAKLVNTLEGNTLVLAQYIEKHLIPLYEIVMGKCAEKEIYLVYGATPTEERERVRGLVENSKKDTVILASYGTFSTGINVKRLHNIVFASPYKSQIKVLQSIGRGLRVAKDKEMVKIFDISDDLVYNNKENYTLVHLRERIKIYNEQEFNYEIVPVKLGSDK
tara:strand:- start:2107 stop:3570 length:1464 start_codon:yes stop_codon:yes gene_type:complete